MTLLNIVVIVTIHDEFKPFGVTMLLFNDKLKEIISVRMPFLHTGIAYDRHILCRCGDEKGCLHMDTARPA